MPVYPGAQKSPYHSLWERQSWGFDECNRLWVLKNYRKESEVLGGVTQLFFLSVLLSSSFQNGPRRMAEEPHQALEVLGSGGQEELLPHKLQSPQA
jgi:hypothetical protein